MERTLQADRATGTEREVRSCKAGSWNALGPVWRKLSVCAGKAGEGRGFVSGSKEFELYNEGIENL